ncbi:hypothetical protein VPHPS32B4_0068 [Vibrio phage PS32B-4]
MNYLLAACLLRSRGYLSKRHIIIGSHSGYTCTFMLSLASMGKVNLCKPLIIRVFIVVFFPLVSIVTDYLSQSIFISLFSYLVY